MGFPRGARQLPGFALIITLSLMVLMTIIAVGLLGLSSISLRGSGQGDAVARARANARMSLMLAIGELQREAGLDTRVTARADILDKNNGPLLGVWKSWEGTDHDASTGRPIAPSNYKSRKQQRFLSWMLSGAKRGASTLPDIAERRGSVPLVGGGTVGNDHNKLQIHAEPVKIDEGKDRGAVAWWIGGENQKARLPKPFEPETDSPARWSVLAKSHAVADPSIFRMDKLMDDASPAAKVVSHQLSDFVGEAEGSTRVSREFFHDLSAVSVGLLTNTATGGWRKDLSLATEYWSGLSNNNLPFFRVTPEKDLMYNKPSSASPYPSRSVLYPWSSYRGSSQIPIYRHAAVNTWENLKNYATLYKTITASASGRNRITPQYAAIDDAGSANSYNFIHKVRILPVVARVQWVYSHYATTSPAGASLVTPQLLLTPVITMWNPYSVEMNAPAMSFLLPKPLPSALRYTVNGVQDATYSSLFSGSTNYSAMAPITSELRYEIKSGYTLMPGETKVFSPAANAIVTLPSDSTMPQPNPLELTPGYRAKGGHAISLLDPVTKKARAVSATAKIRADAKFDTAYNDNATYTGPPGVGIFLDIFVSGVRTLAYRMIYPEAVANKVYKPLPNLAEASLSSAASTPVPFMSTIFGARMASRTHVPAKGFVQSSPLVNYTAMGGKDLIEETIHQHYRGTGHPVNSPFDYSFVEHSAGGDSYLPNSSDSSQRGYIVTGFLKGDGLSRCVIAEIPVRPLQSICELQNWDLRYENPIPPFAFNLIGNSDATPLIPAGAVYNSGPPSADLNLQHDDSYCANHVLFDDWFFSSIAPDPSSYGGSGRTTQQVYSSFLAGEQPLGNTAYRPIREDAGADSSKADKIFTSLKSANGWKSAASRLEVEGMFNVNSTSEAAWRALLGHAREQRVPYIRESGTSWSVDSSEASEHPFSRFSIAGDVQAGKATGAGGFPGASEFTGYRTLDDNLIEEMAREIVEQVRARGPFLSLSEFINRQLSSGDLALAGAVQAALNKLAEKGQSGPYGTLEGLSKDSVADPDQAAGEAEYSFKQAAVGESAYGLPGWTRQADVLRPLAPILSARDDTFTIRAHGDARDEKGNIISRAVCEAVVQRTRNYVDSKDSADLATVPTSSVNKIFGRRFEIVSFRWLNPSEI
ncbi:hypothetical protein [Haloferula sp. BvORR071]|uniref:hypothetical protein n=1 Tax=Haloferula sp. BvORR071 TaxID=1396141 RepID=UPI000551A699|nr:hypothetical protein [Haloferula sp. BvORR071]